MTYASRAPLYRHQTPRWGSAQYTLEIICPTIAHAWKRGVPNQLFSCPILSTHAVNLLLFLKGWLHFTALVPCHVLSYFISSCAIERITVLLNSPINTLKQDSVALVSKIGLNLCVQMVHKAGAFLVGIVCRAIDDEDPFHIWISF